MIYGNWVYSFVEYRGNILYVFLVEFRVGPTL